MIGTQRSVGRPRVPLTLRVLLALGLMLFGALAAFGAYIIVDVLQDRTSLFADIALMYGVGSFVVGVLGIALCLLPFFRRSR